MRYVALLRGINVGGKNLIRMADLRLALEGLGLEDVSTYIASGNVLFRAPRQEADALAARIEAGLEERFDVPLRVALLSERQLRAVVADAPEGFGAATDKCDVLFLLRSISPARAMAAVEIKDGVDRAWPGKRVLYFARLADRASSSRLSKLAAKPEYKEMTVRSWSTTQKLAALLD